MVPLSSQVYTLGCRGPVGCHSGWRFYTGSLDDLVVELLSWRGAADGRSIAVCNVHMFEEAKRDSELATAVQSSAMALCDGQPIAWMIGMLAGANVPRVTGPDLLKHILSDHLQDFRVALVGGTQALLERIAGRLNPGGRSNVLILDPGSVEDGARPDQQLIQRLRKFRPDIVFVGLGCPKQEKWMSQAANEVPATFIGVGAAFQYFLGDIRRAPDFVGRLGLEWAYRLAQQPRLAWRYARTNIAFLPALLSVIFARQADN